MERNTLVNYLALKRGIDASVSAVALIILSPLLATAAIYTATFLGRPVLYAERRPGRGAVLFTLYKFRTMTTQTDSYGHLLPDERRLTPAGRLLRSLSIDELPQLWNVLCGDMSLVGPRPLVERYTARFSQRQRRRLEVKPGITGWAQIHGRNTITWNQKFEYDVWYVDHISFLLDLRILGLTLLRVLKRDGITPVDSEITEEFMGDDSRPVAAPSFTGKDRDS
jgi:lipopolysaccharide/colanic/teichoic acid biosynthesis glycosyltransferase